MGLQGDPEGALASLPFSSSLVSLQVLLELHLSRPRVNVCGAAVILSQCFYLRSLRSVREVTMNVCASFPSACLSGSGPCPKPGLSLPLWFEGGLIQGTPEHAEP